MSLPPVIGRVRSDRRCDGLAIWPTWMATATGLGNRDLPDVVQFGRSEGVGALRIAQPESSPDAVGARRTFRARYSRETPEKIPSGRGIER
jgi:hypothetical protein